MVIITREILERGKSRNGGWSVKQLQTLGIKNFLKGWKSRLIGSEVSEQQVKRFLELKDNHLRKEMQKHCEVLLFSEPDEDLSHILSIRQENCEAIRPTEGSRNYFEKD